MVAEPAGDAWLVLAGRSLSGSALDPESCVPEADCSSRGLGDRMQGMPGTGEGDQEQGLGSRVRPQPTKTMTRLAGLHQARLKFLSAAFVA